MYLIYSLVPNENLTFKALQFFGSCLEFVGQHLIFDFALNFLHFHSVFAWLWKHGVRIYSLFWFSLWTRVKWSVGGLVGKNITTSSRSIHGFVQGLSFWVNFSKRRGRADTHSSNSLFFRFIISWLWFKHLSNFNNFACIFLDLFIFVINTESFRILFFIESLSDKILGNLRCLWSHF